MPDVPSERELWRSSLLQRVLLTAMDYVGNRPHGVVLPFNYWGEPRWREAWDRLGLRTVGYLPDLKLYPFPFSLVFSSGLHFAAALERKPAR